MIYFYELLFEKKIVIISNVFENMILISYNL